MALEHAVTLTRLAERDSRFDDVKQHARGTSSDRRYANLWRKDEIIERLQAAEPTLRAMGVDALFLFGSCARDEAGATSDVDVFIDPVPGKAFGFGPFMEAFEAIQESPIDYGTRTGLHPLLRAEIEREASRVF